jgi:hypothetical protein
VEKARQFVEQHMSAKMDTYTLAVMANFAADYGKDREFTGRAMQLLLDARTEKDDRPGGPPRRPASTARGASASVETTGLAVQALLKWGRPRHHGIQGARLHRLEEGCVRHVGHHAGHHHGAARLLLSTEKGAADVRGTVEITLNGKPVEKLTLTAENNDLLHQFAFKNVDSKGANAWNSASTGKGGLAYQVVGRYFVPWDEKPANEPLSIDVPTTARAWRRTISPRPPPP